MSLAVEHDIVALPFFGLHSNIVTNQLVGRFKTCSRCEESR